MKKIIQINNKEIQINGLMFYHDSEKKIPTIILSHEFGSSMKLTKRYAEGLYKSGYNVFIYDFPGSGAGTSKGRNSVDMSVLTEKEDLGTVFDYIRSLQYVDSEKIILGGASLGGVVTALFAAENTDKIYKMFLYYPAFCAAEDASDGCVLGTKVDLNNIPSEYKVMGKIKLGPSYITDLISIDLWNEISKFKKPVLICHGNKDSIVDIKYSVKAAQLYSDCLFIEFKGAQHCFFMPWTMRKAVRETVDFLSK